MTTPNDARIDALYDQMDAHYRDRDPDCTCWDCRLVAAMDENDRSQQERGAHFRRMTRPQRLRVVPMNRQWQK